MTHFGHCPACGEEIPQERIFNGSAICQCGWTKSITAFKANEKAIDRVCIGMILMAALLVGSFIHSVNWDRHFFGIVPLKISQWTDSATIADLQEIAEICIERKKHDCVEIAYEQQYSKNPKDITPLAKLGNLQALREKWPEAVTTYASYFAQDGEDLEAAYNYAKALGHVGQVDKAEMFYNRVLKAKPDVLQITVTRHYINMLVEHNRLKKAKSVIEYFRKQGTNTGYFMDKEYKEIKQRLSNSKYAQS